MGALFPYARLSKDEYLDAQLTTRSPPLFDDDGGGGDDGDDSAKGEWRALPVAERTASTGSSQYARLLLIYSNKRQKSVDLDVMSITKSAF